MVERGNVWAQRALKLPQDIPDDALALSAQFSNDLIAEYELTTFVSSILLDMLFRNRASHS